MSENTPSSSESESKDDLVFSFATFLATSARGSLQEGVFSGSLRLLDALGRLKQLFPEIVLQDQFLEEVTELANKGKTESFLESKEAYIKFLDELLAKFAREIKRRNGI